jgi:hypothetical protein
MIHKKQQKNVEYFKQLGSIVTSDAIGAREVKSRLATCKTALNREKHFPPRSLTYI